MSVKKIDRFDVKGKPDFKIEKSNSPFKSEAKKDRKILILVDVQNDYISGTLANESTKAVNNNIIGKIMNHYEEYDAFYFIKDRHYENYYLTLESKTMPEHCINGTNGFRFTDGILNAISFLREKRKFVKIIDKHTFGSTALTDMLSCVCGNNDEIELAGVFTDTNVISNALSLRQAMPNRIIKIDSGCCAGSSNEAHEAALVVMKSCQIEVI